MKKSKESIITLIAFLLSVALHAGVFTGVGLLSGIKIGGLQNILKKEEKEIFSIETVESKDLPDISKIDRKSSMKNRKEEKSKQIIKQDSGLESKNINIKSILNENEESLNFEDSVKLKIQKARNYPESAKRMGAEGDVWLSFEVLKNGNLGKVNIIKSSGFEVLDEEAINTLKRAAPFPEIPEYYNMLKMNLQLKIIYKLN